MSLLSTMAKVFESVDFETPSTLASIVIEIRRGTSQYPEARAVR